MAVPGVLAEFARVVRPDGALRLTVAFGDGQGFEATINYGSTLRRRFTYHHEQPLRELLAAADFTVRSVRRESTHREWLQLRAER